METFNPSFHNHVHRNYPMYHSVIFNNFKSIIQQLNEDFFKWLKLLEWYLHVYPVYIIS